MPYIVPSILENSFEKFAEVFNKIDGLAECIEIDVMDGIFVPNKSFEDIERLNELNPLSKWKLHLMVDDALAAIAKWKDIKNVAKIVFHIESRSDPLACVDAIRGQGRQVGIAIKSETPLEAVKPYLGLIDELTFMTVNPGQQGGKFLSDVGEKIKAFNNLTTVIPAKAGIRDLAMADSRFRGNDSLIATDSLDVRRGNGSVPLVAVDGGINKNTIAIAKSWGVDIFGVGSAIAKAENPKKVYEELLKKAGKV